MASYAYHQLMNSVLNGGLPQLISDKNPTVCLYSGGTRIICESVTGFYTSMNGVASATHRISFAPTGIAGGGYYYDALEMWNDTLENPLYHLDLSPARFIANGDVHQILIKFSGGQLDT